MDLSIEQFMSKYAPVRTWSSHRGRHWLLKEKIEIHITPMNYWHIRLSQCKWELNPHGRGDADLMRKITKLFGKR